MDILKSIEPDNEYVIAMSGGVDSSTATALLIDKGVNVKGKILHIWGNKIDEESVPNIESVDQARKVADKFGIEFEIVDVREDFKKYIINEFLQGYQNGLTPNPCVLCNKFIKFGVFLDYINNDGFGTLVTGHYAKIVLSTEGIYLLYRGKDSSKDQSYFLSQLDQLQLRRSLFPLGDYTKEEVWQLAKYYDIQFPERKESQDLCFLKDQDYREFIKRNVGNLIKPGVITDRFGKAMGSHNGLAYYTIGQRKGLGVNSTHPMYVIEKNIKTNTLIIGPEDGLGQSQLLINDLNWISGTPQKEVFRSEVKIRSTAKLEWAMIYPEESNKVKVLFDNCIRDITPGQFAVLYNGDRVLGGGEIAL